MTPQKFLDKVYPYIKRYAANLHERVDLRITAASSYKQDPTIFTKLIDEDLFGLAQVLFGGPIQDSHTGEIRDEPGATWEMALTLKALFELEVVRQASEIHSGRGKMLDTQYAFCKAVVREYFRMVKGYPDELLRTPPLCPACGLEMSKKMIDEVLLWVCMNDSTKLPITTSENIP